MAPAAVAGRETGIGGPAIARGGLADIRRGGAGALTRNLRGHPPRDPEPASAPPSAFQRLEAIHAVAPPLPEPFTPGPADGCGEHIVKGYETAWSRKSASGGYGYIGFRCALPAAALLGW